MYLGVGLLGHRIKVCLAILNNARQFSKVVVQNAFSAAMLESSSYSTSLSTLSIVCHLNFSCSGGCDVVYIVVLTCVSLISNDIEHLFM